MNISVTNVKLIQINVINKNVDVINYDYFINSNIIIIKKYNNMQQIINKCISVNHNNKIIIFINVLNVLR